MIGNGNRMETGPFPIMAFRHGGGGRHSILTYCLETVCVQLHEKKLQRL